MNHLLQPRETTSVLRNKIGEKKAQMKLMKKCKCISLLSTVKSTLPTSGSGKILQSLQLLFPAKLEDPSLGKMQRQYLHQCPEAVLFPVLGHLISSRHWNRTICKRQKSDWRKMARGVIFYSIRESYVLEFTAEKLPVRPSKDCLLEPVLTLLVFKPECQDIRRQIGLLNVTENKGLLGSLIQYSVSCQCRRLVWPTLSWFTFVPLQQWSGLLSGQVHWMTTICFSVAVNNVERSM